MDEKKSDLKRNWRLRLETSILSMSMTSSSLKPDKAKSFSNSQPNPPAPTTSTFTYSFKSSLSWKNQPTKQTPNVGNASQSVCENVWEKKKTRKGLLLRGRARKWVRRDCRAWGGACRGLAIGSAEPPSLPLQTFLLLRQVLVLGFSFFCGERERERLTNLWSAKLERSIFVLSG